MVFSLVFSSSSQILFFLSLKLLWSLTCIFCYTGIYGLFLWIFHDLYRCNGEVTHNTGLRPGGLDSKLVGTCSKKFMFKKGVKTIYYRAHFSPINGHQDELLHYRFLVPDNIQKNLTEIWHHFWLKMMVKSGLEKNILKFHDGLQSCCCPVQKHLHRKAESAWQVSRYLWRQALNFKIFFSRPLFMIILSPKWYQISVRIFCVLPATKNLQC